MTDPIDEYVSRIERACGEEDDYVVVLRYERCREALERILSRCRVEKTISGIMTRASYERVTLTLFPTGKILLKGVGDEGEAENLLRELLRD